jgi:hypothetical protein
MLEAETARKGVPGDSDRSAFPKKKPSKSKKNKQDDVKQDASAMMINYENKKVPDGKRVGKDKNSKTKKGDDDYEEFVANIPAEKK